MENKIEAINMLFALFSVNFVKEFKGSTIDKALTDEQTKELLHMVGNSIDQTVKDIASEDNKEKTEGDKKYV